MKNKINIPIWKKTNLTVDEAAAYCGIGVKKLRKMTESEDCPFVLWNGTKRLIKRQQLDEYLENTLVYYDHRTEGSKKGCYFNVNTTKTPASMRQVPMLDFVKEAFELEKQKQKDLDIHCEVTIDGYSDLLGNTGSFNQQINGLTPNENECDPYFLLTESALWSAKMKSSAAAGTMQIVNRTEFSELKTWLPSLIEQQAISDFFRQLDNLITLHQRKWKRINFAVHTD